MTQRNEEWAKPVGDQRVVLQLEVIDESVRLLPEVIAGIQGQAEEAGRPPTLLSYGEAVNLIYDAGFRPIDLQTREPIMDWKPPKDIRRLRQQELVPPETKAAAAAKRTSTEMK